MHFLELEDPNSRVCLLSCSQSGIPAYPGVHRSKHESQSQGSTLIKPELNFRIQRPEQTKTVFKR